MSVTQAEATVLDTPQAIGFWHWRSRLGQLALEINTGLKAGRKPILRAMYEQGMIDAPLRGTKANKVLVLGLMVAQMQEADPSWPIPATVARALGKPAVTTDELSSLIDGNPWR